MPDPQDASATAPPRSKVVIVASVATLFILSLLTFIGYPRATTEPWLDPSYEEAYGYFLKSGAQAGVDYAFTYGPLGHFIIPRFDHDLFYFDCAVAILMALAAAVPLAAWGARNRSGYAMLALAAIVAGLVPGTAGPEIGFLIAVVAATLWLLHSSNPNALACAATGILFAFLALTKFTLLVLNSAAVGVLLLHLIAGRRVGPAVTLAACYSGFMAIFWVVAGQHPFNFPAYVLASLQVSEAYNAGMYTTGKTSEVVWGVFLWTALVALLVLRRRTTHAGPWSNTLPLLFILFVMLLTWKMGIVRHQGHINKFFVPMATIPFFLPFTTHIDDRKRWALVGLSALVVVTGASGYFIVKSSSPADQAVRTGRRLIGVVNQTIALPRVYEGRSKRLRQYRSLYGLPEIQTRIENETVDIFSANQATVIFNRLNYHPRPVFQGYQACTPELQRWNGDFYRGENAPRYILNVPALTPIDNRYPASEDAEALKALFSHYRPVLFERGMYLFERVDTSPPVAPPVDVRNERKIMGEWVELDPDHKHWRLLALDLQPTWRGQLRGIAYKLPELRMTIRFDDGQEQAFRVNIGSIETGFILDPFFGVLDSLDAWPLGTGAKRVTAFQVSTIPPDHWAVKAEYEMEMRTIAPLATSSQTASYGSDN